MVAVNPEEILPEEGSEAVALRELSGAVDQLRDVVGVLTEVVERANESAQENTEYLKLKIAALTKADDRRKRSVRWAFATIAADLLVTSIGLVIWHSQAETNRRIQESLRSTYITQQEQQATRVRVLCPLYSLMLASVDPKARAAMPPAQQKVYDHTVQVIRDGYGTLGCQPQLPPATPSRSAAG